MDSQPLEKEFTVLEVSQAMNVGYIHLCTVFKKGKIPFRMDSGRRLVKKDVLEKLIQIRKEHGSRWIKELDFVPSEDDQVPVQDQTEKVSIPALPHHTLPEIKETPNDVVLPAGLSSAPQPTQEAPAIKAPAQGQLAQKIFQRAKELNKEGKFEASSEFFMFLVDNGNSFFFYD